MNLRMIALALGVPAFAANWPQFRGPSASGRGDGSPATVWDGASGKNILWKTAIPGLGYSSPVVWGGRVFLTSAVAKDGAATVRLGLYGAIQPVEGEGAQSFDVFCLDRKSGKLLWRRTATSGQAKVKRHPKSSHANPTPATDGQVLAVSFGSEGLFAYDLEGKLLWKKDLGVLDAGFHAVPGAQWGYSSSPVLHEGVLFIQADVQKNSFLAAFDSKTGKELWRTPRADVPTFSTPAIVPAGASGHQVVVNGWKHIGGYDAKTGRELWKMPGGGDIPVPTPVFDNGLTVITNAHGPGRPIYAIKDGGAIAWTQEKVGNYMQTPLLAEGLGYFCFDNGVLTVFELSTGERLYQQRLGAGSSGFSSSPVAAADRLYITNEEGHTYVLRQGRKYELAAENDLGESVMATPAIADGVLFVRGASHLFAIGAR